MKKYNRTKKTIRKTRKIKRMTARFITILTMFLIVLTVAGSLSSFAGSKDIAKLASEKQYTSVLIYPGDSLDSLTDQYISPEYKNREKLKMEIMSINHLSPDKVLTAGNHIIVPVYR